MNIPEEFYFTPEDLRSWPFLGEFYEKLGEGFNWNLLTDEQKKRFVLVSLIPIYRLFNWAGYRFTTSISKVEAMEMDPKIIKKLKAANAFLGHPVNSTEEFLDALGKVPGVPITGEYLRDFVFYGWPGP